MDKEFIPYEQALALKELGFDEPCIACYTENAFGITPEQKVQYWREPIGGNDDYVFVLAPLKQQVFRWFREKYADVLVKDYGLIPHFTMIQNMFLDSNKIWTCEEAENACIDKLIEIAKQQDNDTNPK
jgi:hypothetical protein